MMEVIPVINCSDSKCVLERLEKVREFDSDWVHIDIAGGKFAPVTTWNKPTELNSQLTTYNLQLNIEVHLMVEKPEEFVDEWLEIGAKRIIIHLEVINTNRLTKILEKCSEHDAELMLAINPETPVEELFPYLDSLLFVQFLAVKPGFSRQKFNNAVIEKIKVLRERVPDIVIEVDGGINPETAKLVKEAGADIVASASYIFNNPDPRKAYQDLVEVMNLPR